MFRRVQISIVAAVFTAVVLALTPAVFADDGDVLFQGKWTKKTKKIEGTWKIVEDGGERYIILDEKFKTKKGPDLKIFLSTKTLDTVSNKNAVKGSVKVALLKSNKGAQRYQISAEVDLSRYKTLLVHCEKYAKLWGAAKLPPPQP